MPFEPIFVTGTGTDVGKTYVTALLCRALQAQLSAGESAQSAGQAAVRYYKAAISGADSIADSDAGWVIKMAGLHQDLRTATTYLYREPVSPHLAYCNEVAAGKTPPEPKLSQVLTDFTAVHDSCALTVLEGSGGIYCPLWCQPESLGMGRAASCYTICDLMRELVGRCGLKVMVVADAQLGCINDVLTTVQSLKYEGFDLSRVAIILNHYEPSSLMQRNNVGMIESLTQLPVIATVQAGQTRLELSTAALQFLTADSVSKEVYRALFQINQGLSWWPEQQ